MRSLRISIHAPSRERQHKYQELTYWRDFNPRSLAGATATFEDHCQIRHISIHAPSRERLKILKTWNSVITFQSTLPRGSDLAEPSRLYLPVHFNPRSLAGATFSRFYCNSVHSNFNPRSLAGATSGVPWFA